jgi:hypothetical protein
MRADIPSIHNFTYHSFKTPKGRFMEVHYGNIIETFYSHYDRLKVPIKNWYLDDDIVDGLNNFINEYKTKNKV